jgi:transposase
VKGEGVGAPEQGGSQPERAGAPRVVTADRGQLAWRTCDLESLLPAEHRARLIWLAVEKLDLTKFYEPIAARENEPGRPAIDPKILVALWLYATSEGVGSARELARLCGAHDAYRWICGGVSVNHHTLSDFRVGHAAALDDLMTQVLAVLLHGGLVTLERVAQDGMRVRASAGAASFRREKGLQGCLEAARRQVEEAKRQADEPDTQRSARERAAAERAAREREERVTRALAELPKVQAAKSGTKGREQARVSTTDPEARVMKMGDGGYRPAYNAQFATDTSSRVIVGVGVTNSGSDMGQADPLRADIERRTGEAAKELLLDGGFVKKESIEDASTAGTTEAKEIYKQRAATAETVNADLRRWRGLDRFLVRGKGKVFSVILWSAITYNVMRWIGAGMGG